MLRVLLVEDEKELTKAIELALRESEFAVDVALDGRTGLSKAMSADYDVIILDLMLPQLNGQELIVELRKEKATPVLVLTARDSSAEKTMLLNLGADDYVTKPFDLDEFLARIRALVRRSVHFPAPNIEVADIVVNTTSRSVSKLGKRVYLTTKEYAVLHLLLNRRGEWMSREAIFQRIYGDQDNTFSNVIDVYIAKLRKKLGADLIVTQRGAGYTINA
jgi:two-component system, OmpR family, response regulator